MRFEPPSTPDFYQPAMGHGGLAPTNGQEQSPGSARMNRVEEYNTPPALIPSAAPTRAWTEAQTRSVAEMSGWTIARTEWLDSLEVTRLVHGQVQREVHLALEEIGPSSLEAAIFSPAPGLPGGVSSPFGGQVTAQKQFWFNVNAELVIYGATEPDAQVTIGGRPIRLRPDGTFSYRFALPDGAYELPIAATAAHGDRRHAHLQFHRGTSYSGDVGVHPQDPSLKTPDPRHVA
jgi:hypothetical protein